LGIIHNDHAEIPNLRERGYILIPREGTSLQLVLAPNDREDEETIQALFERIDLVFDLSEPFSRIREAMGEARKMGVNQRG
jgi:hypothetical protein